ncbi:glutamate-cysteine ligase catalytic subunit [Fistulina hepatica ATCC 64428]|uniref:Glutamate--cysteine ligase n=1 Tax=Fistulina hepatica ATCC 64428 TaxID=1128425 RepID=A0A0D7A0S9_9AGAR|nr:glutamate-cysteine ligase catalytic subunit [Fistulina hepatica ATCC 64428]
MGLLAKGTPLPWSEAQKYANHVRYHGITQFLHTWDRLKDRHGDVLLWGDEIEYMVVSFDKETRNATLSLRQSEILQKLESIADNICANRDNKIAAPTFHPEYGRYMLESTPGSPYTGSITDLLSVESNMRYRRDLARQHLKPNEIPFTFTSFPRLGTPGQFTDQYYDPADATSSHSLFLPEEIANPHIRFPTLTANIRRRRGSKVVINLPIFIDTNTPRPFVDPTIPWHRNVYREDPEAKNGAALLDHIYMDAMGFGMGCCCLQLTFQACNVSEARTMYDGLIPVGPILLALSAASPLWRGYISDVDCRWNVIAGSVDDRTEEERGLKPLKKDRFKIPKSRYDSVDLYISKTRVNRPEYNDSDVPYDEEIRRRLIDHGIDELLAKHIAHLFIRDPLVVFTETIDQDDTTSADHFENIQSTNWQTLRFKPPPPNSKIGWRVEFRSMEVQPTDFENAAFAVFVVLLSRAILSFHLNFYIPITKVDENMARAQRRGAATDGKFFFRKDVYPSGSSSSSSVSSSDEETRPKTTKLENCFPPLPPVQNGVNHPIPVEEEYEEMSLNEIMNGKVMRLISEKKLWDSRAQENGSFPGFLGLINSYLDTVDISSLQTPATWIRNFVRSHPAYRRDSVVSQEINYDLMVAIDEIERGLRREPTLLPQDYKGGIEDQGDIGL